MIPIICLVMLLPEVAHSAQGHYAHKLLNDLMENYSSALRPVEDTDRALNVTLQITLSQIKDMEETLLIHLILIDRQTWHDTYLQWDKEDYDGLEVIHIPSSLVWRPDLVLYNKYAVRKYYIATMTMVTASTSLTIFIMNIHFCGAEAKPVPQKHSTEQDWQGRKYPRPQTPKLQHPPRVKAQPHITRDEGSHFSSFTPGKYEGSNGKIPTGDCFKEDQKVPCYPEDQKLPCCPEDKKPPPQSPCVTFGPCIFCSHGSGFPGADTKLVRNVEYIAKCFREQRATCAKGAEWKKIAKVMDRFFMWIFFIMVFLMSILIIGKAP
ncbi:Neuronal acetylcholine receptor subunit alpha-9-II [Dissostichus eleginoides]|uniref:Neuronal acetylcholine receptor subunit alpha-9-II n=1 Tax=Dissostichus eleginoides TaxID=100907 RepID=A0AAD9CPN4_DISEL|nr:Neuronal acetylcholine receptor subunit alpha-9-II [Dissostichus eleginoides]